jgi:hypothetical protein
MIEVDERLIGSDSHLSRTEVLCYVQEGGIFSGRVDVRASHIKQLKLSVIRM